MEAIGRQVRLPIKTAMQIAMQGIKIRLGRALVTISGVVLGIAFLMNVLAGSHISTAMKKEEDVRMKVDMMVSLVKMQIENPKRQTIAVLATGTVATHEREAIRSLLRTGLHVRANGLQMAKVEQAQLADLTAGTEAVLIIGDGEKCPLPVTTLTAQMKQRVILDTREDRTFDGAAYREASGVRRELFFGKRMLDEQKKLQEHQRQQKFRNLWIVCISLLVTIIGIANAMLMSVTERFKEIGTMKCLGALSSFIRQMFLIESAVIGLVGSLAGILIGMIFPLLLYSFAYGFKNVFGGVDFGHMGVVSLECVLAGTVLSIIAAIYPATIAARMIPAMALRTNV
ncbi:MAG: ABC transporter permease [Armatimonadota bacterium]